MKLLHYSFYKYALVSFFIVDFLDFPGSGGNSVVISRFQWGFPYNGIK
jgi:hypothetical protein